MRTANDVFLGKLGEELSFGLVAKYAGLERTVRAADGLSRDSYLSPAEQPDREGLQAVKTDALRDAVMQGVQGQTSTAIDPDPCSANDSRVRFSLQPEFQYQVRIVHSVHPIRIQPTVLPVEGIHNAEYGYGKDTLRPEIKMLSRTKNLVPLYR
jgi:hypothetical protein